VASSTTSITNAPSITWFIWFEAPWSCSFQSGGDSSINLQWLKITSHHSATESLHSSQSWDGLRLSHCMLMLFLGRSTQLISMLTMWTQPRVYFEFDWRIRLAWTWQNWLLFITVGWCVDLLAAFYFWALGSGMPTRMPTSRCGMSSDWRFLVQLSSLFSLVRRCLTDPSSSRVPHSSLRLAYPQFKTDLLKALQRLKTILAADDIAGVEYDTPNTNRARYVHMLNLYSIFEFCIPAIQDYLVVLKSNNWEEFRCCFRRCRFFLSCLYLHAISHRIHNIIFFCHPIL